MVPCKYYLIAFLIITVPLMILQGLVVYWIHQLQTKATCPCAFQKGWYASYIKWYLVTLIAWSLILWGYRFGNNCETTLTRMHPFFMIFSFIVSAAAFAFVVISFKFLRSLKESNCQCALKGPGDDVLRVLMYLQLSAYVIIGLVLLASIAIVAYNVAIAMRSRTGSRVAK